MVRWGSGEVVVLVCVCVGGGHHFNTLLSKCRVYIAEGGPLCVPLQISRSKRGKHG